MSGHSKWATTKHRKAAVDKARGKLFAKLIRQLEVAARDGGGDLDANATLRTMYDKARAASVPADTIDRAIKRGTGELEGVHYEATSYEGYAACGVAVIVECLTDNRNRTGADVRNLFARNGGSMAEPGSVSWQFARKGQIYLPGALEEDKVMEIALEAGADDVARDGDMWLVSCGTLVFNDCLAAMESAGITAESSELALVATTEVPVTQEADARKIFKLIEALDDHDDVQSVWSNCDIPDEIVTAIGDG